MPLLLSRTEHFYDNVDYSKHTSKGKDVPVQAMKSYRVSSGTDTLILNFGSRWRLEVNRSERDPVTTEQVAGSEDLEKSKISCQRRNSNPGPYNLYLLTYLLTYSMEQSPS